MDNGSIKENIFKKRNEEGLSQDEMAQRLGIVRNTYRKIEKGSAKLVSDHINTIAEVLGTSAEELVLGYKPLDGTRMLEDLRIKYETRISEAAESYESRIAYLESTLSAREREIRDLREIVESKNEIISLMKRNSGSN